MKTKYILSLLLLTAGVATTFSSQAFLFFGRGNACCPAYYNECPSCPVAYEYVEPACPSCPDAGYYGGYYY